MTAVLVDDEKLGLDYLELLCKNITMLNDIHCFTKSREALQWCKDNHVDIAMLDINLLSCQIHNPA